MKIPLIVSLLALLLSGIAVAKLLTDRSASMLQKEAPLLAAGPVRDTELQAQVAALREENRELRERLEALELRTASAGSAPLQRAPVTDGFASEKELEALRAELRAAVGEQKALAALGPDESPSPEFTEHVSRAMSEIRVKEAVENARKRVESRSARLKERMPKASEELQLIPRQERALESALVVLYEKQANYGVLWATGEVENRSDFGEIYRNDLEAFVEELGGFLTPQQLEDYLDLQGADGDLFPGDNKRDDDE